MVNHMKNEWKRAFFHPIFWLGVVIITLVLYASGRNALLSLETHGQVPPEYLLRGMEYSVNGYVNIYWSSLMNYALWLWPFWVGIPYIVEYATELSAGFAPMMNLRTGKKGIYERRKLLISGLISGCSVIFPLLLYLLILYLRIGHFGPGRYIVELQGGIDRLPFVFIHPHALFHQILLIGAYGVVLGILGALLARKLKLPAFSYLFVPVCLIGQNKIFETFAFLTKSRIWNSFNILGIYVMDIYSYRYVIIQLFVLICFVYFLYEHEKRCEVEL